MSKKSLPIIQRTCGECQKCCEGWLEAEIYDHKAHAGQACFFIGTEKAGCSIYADRPQFPCVQYTCSWLDEPETFPNWLKPNLSKVIITKKTINDTDVAYYEVVEAGSTIDSSVLNWLIHWALRNEKSLIYQVQGKSHTLANQELGKLLNQK